jgi:hypothetical protein
MNILLFILGFLSCTSWVPFNTAKYNHRETLILPDQTNIELFWSLDKNKINFGVASNNGNRWLAIGTSDAGGMKGATD